MSARVIPSMMRKWTVKKIVNNFRDACVLGEFPVPKPGPKEILVKNRFVGINASDINITAGRYDPSTRPEDVGLEGVGEVVKVGEGCTRIKEGQAIGHAVIGSFSEYQAIPEGAAMPLPSIQSDFIPLILSGLGTSIALDTVGKIQPSDTVLVTAAAGGAGQMAVQYAKVQGCHVIGTCSSDKKAQFLKDLGCDRVINHNKENVGKVLKSEYPQGIDVVFENVGGKLLTYAVNSIAFKGRIIIFGFISAYEKSDMSMDVFPNLGVLIARCAKMEGFIFFAGLKLFPEYFKKLIELKSQGKMKTFIDTGSSTDGGTFRGLDDIPRAVEHLYSGKSFGKIVVDLSEGELKGKL